MGGFTARLKEELGIPVKLDSGATEPGTQLCSDGDRRLDAERRRFGVYNFRIRLDRLPRVNVESERRGVQKRNSSARFLLPRDAVRQSVPARQGREQISERRSNETTLCPARIRRLENCRERKLARSSINIAGL